MMSKEGSTKIVNFMTPRAGILVLGCGLYKLCSENALFLEESPSFNSGIDQTNWEYSNATKEESTKIGKFYLITPGVGVLVVWRGLLPFLSTLGHGSDKLSIRQ